MYCDACGARLEDGQNFCRTCGKAAGAVAVAPVAAPPRPERRVAAHLRVLAVLWIARGVMLAIPGAFLAAFSRWQFPVEVPADVQSFIHPLLGSIGWILLMGAVACIIAAWGLLEHASWARIFTIIVGAISLVEVPFGTVLGVYSLWVLLPESSETEYRELAMQ